MRIRVLRLQIMGPKDERSPARRLERAECSMRGYYCHVDSVYSSYLGVGMPLNLFKSFLYFSINFYDGHHTVLLRLIPRYPVCCVVVFFKKKPFLLHFLIAC